jgi:putative ABC transport system permease protein
MKPIVVRDQVRLGPLRCLTLTLTGMSYRLFRSLITVAILALAVAFLVHMLGYALMAEHTRQRAWQQLQHSRALGLWVTRLTAPDTEATVLAGLAAPEQPGRLEEYRAWSAASPAEFAQARQLARQLDELWRYYDGLSVAARAVLSGGVEPAEAIAALVDEQNYRIFLRRLDELRLPPPLGDLAAFEQLVREGRPQLSGIVRRIQHGHQRAIEQVRRAFAGRDPRDVLAELPAELPGVLAAAGFETSPAALAHVAELARAAQDLERLNAAVDSPALRRELSRQMRTPVLRVDLAGVLRWLDRPARSEWLAAVLREHGIEELGGERLLGLARNFERQNRLQKIVGEDIPQARVGLDALPVATRWLIAVSFLVCVVGVANAMLMSVTERFTEIATMKCLGALDGFIMQVFFFEAMLQGLIGGLVGLLIGIGLALARGAAEYGTVLLEALPLTDVLWGALASWAAGILMAAVAAIGPVWVAARLAPMEAMRVE